MDDDQINPEEAVDEEEELDENGIPKKIPLVDADTDEYEEDDDEVM